jgi:hypothetical protein
MAKKVTHAKPKGGPFTHFMVDGAEKNRATCVSEIEKGIAYQTSPPGGGGADIHVVEVNSQKYLRTDKNKTAADNLGKLPTY